MKLAIVIGSLARGGSERQIVEFVRSAHPKHAECVVICLSANPGALASEVHSVGAEVLAVGFEAVRSWGAPAALARLAAVLRAERPDVLYAFLFWSHVLALPTAAVAAPQALRVAALRSSPIADVPRRRPLVRLRRPALALVQGAIANSDAVALEWTRSYRHLQGRVHVVPNGVSVPQPHIPRATDVRVPAIICVANLIPYKGHETLLEALAALTDVEWTLLLAGDGPCRSALEEHARRLGLDLRVKFLGTTSDVAGLMRRADLAVLPSYTEGLPNAVLEAMANGLPVVATDVGGVRQMLRCGAGTVVPARDPRALADAIRHYLDNADLRSRAGSLGRKEAERNYGIPAMRDRTLAALEAFAE
jgi:glycosyltransferase involved in cell wall biosynthesis